MAHNVPYLTENMGDAFTIEPANPGAGIMYQFTVPAGFTYRLEQVGFTLQTIGAGIDRRVNVDVETASTKLQYATLVTVVQPTGNTYKYAFAISAQTAAVIGLDLVVQVPLGRWMLPPLSVVFLQVVNHLATDVMTAISYSFRQWQIVP